jgi:D-alanyl-D-alanine carboxypeptidase
MVLASVAVMVVFILAHASVVHASPTVLAKKIPAAEYSSLPSPPDITARAAIVVDTGTGEVLFEQEADTQLPMASTTKIMTATLVLESLDLDEKVVVPQHAAGTAGSVANLQWGEVLTVEQLLYALMVPSGNDAAITLAEETAGSVSAFVEMMNDKAEALGLSNTHFSNPNGLHLEDHYSSARDLATLTQYAMQDPTFRRIVDTPKYELPWPDGSFIREYKSGNVLLEKYPWVDGVKTGSTPYAGYCMVASGTYDGTSLVVVLLGAENDDVRWAEVEALFDYGLTVRPWTVLADKGELVGELDTADPLRRQVRIVAQRALTVRLSPGDEVIRTAQVVDEVMLPVHIGDALGELDFYLDGVLLGSVALVAAQTLDRIPVGEFINQWRLGFAKTLVYAG